MTITKLINSPTLKHPKRAVLGGFLTGREEAVFVT
jgi:hypothetical protein